jgi:CHAT domain-containing protein
LKRHPSDPRRIWWCTTGPLAFLPIHAAGIYGQDHTAEDCLSNYAISSYTPTITTLIGRTKGVKLDQRGPKKLLLISQPNTRRQTPIPGAKIEVDEIFKNITGRGFEATCLEDSAATVDEVKKMMESHSWIHFACHGSQNTEIALQSAFYLHDGEELMLTEIIKKQLDNADLAFLSACQTSTGEEKLSEEAVHLAGGMLAAGYRGVVATMWSIKDQYGPEIAVEFYKHILTSEGGKELNSDMAAYALHYATGCIRKKLGDSESGLLAWVPYVHFGY